MGLRRKNSLGFTLIELLVVLAIIGAISAVAIPALLGQRQKARRIGDAQSNAKVIQMAMETFKAENGTFGPANAQAIWKPSSTTPSLTSFTVNPVPGFVPKGSTTMVYTLVVSANGLTYTLDVVDKTAKNKDGTFYAYRTDQTGRQIYP